MSDDPRVEYLLEELANSQATPEEVCRECPDLLPTVRDEWRRMRQVDAGLDALFPPRDAPVPPPPDATDLPRIPGYEVDSVLGHGGMGIVFRARHLGLNRLVALKMTLDGAYAGTAERDRFKREAEAAAALRHPNVVPIYDIGDVNGRPYFTMEFVDGGSLGQRLAGTPQPARASAELTATLAQAVQAAHECGIVHRDLKPGNVLLSTDGTPKISDFGLSRRLDGQASVSQSGIPIGTPSYMAPEQAQGKAGAVGPAVDVYALGAILYELLTGRPPFRAATAAETLHQVVSQEPAAPSRLNDQVPRDLETVCLKCLHKEPRRRYRTAAELTDDLQRFLGGEPILARRVGPIERAVKWTRRHRSLAASLAIGFLLLNVLLGVGGWVLFQRTALNRAVSEDLDQVVFAQREKKWDQARKALQRAKARLGDGGPSGLRQRAAQLENELTLVATLEDILLGSLDANSPEGEEPQRTAVRYEQALREAGLVNGSEDPKDVAARIRATGIAVPVLAALDDWAWRVDGRRDWLQEVARLVDEDPASRPIRDSRLWENRPALEAFAQSAPLANHSVVFLHFLGRELHRGGGDSTAYYKRVQQAHANSHLANIALAYLLLAKGSADSLRYFQAAIALQPNQAGMHHRLGEALFQLGKWDESLVEFAEATRLAPESAHYGTSVGFVLVNLKRLTEAERQFRKVLETHPTYAYCLRGLGYCLFQQGRHAEAIDAYRRAIAARPKYDDAYRQLKDAYLTRHQYEEGRQVWQEWLAFNPPSHAAWDGYAELCLFVGNKAEYRRVRSELLKRFGATTDIQVAERTGRACLLLPAPEEELRQATKLIDRVMASERAKPGWLLPYCRFAKALAEYRAGRLESALTLLDGDVLRILGPAPRLLLAMVQHRLGKKDAARESFRTATTAYDWDANKATDREAWMCHLLRREAEAVLAGKP
jgi:eukaryotic-like serine/threonine-protein kinase